VAGGDDGVDGVGPDDEDAFVALLCVGVRGGLLMQKWEAWEGCVR